MADAVGLFYPLLQPQQRVTKVRAFSSGGERFPDTEEVTSSNLVTPTTKSRAVGELQRRVFCRATAACHQLQFPMAHPNPKVVQQNANQTPNGGHRTPQAPTCPKKKRRADKEWFRAEKAEGGFGENGADGFNQWKSQHQDECESFAKDFLSRVDRIIRRTEAMSKRADN